MVLEKLFSFKVSISMILQASKFRLSDLPSMPQVDLGVDRFLSPLIIEKLQVSVVDGFAQKVPIVIKTLGVIQPMKPQELLVKPEGQRAWRWYTLHCSVNVELKPNDRVRIRNMVYKVMDKLDYSRSSYLQYGLIEDFENNDVSV